MTSRLIRIGDALSQLGNVIIFNGDPNYSISGEAYRRNRPVLRRVIDALMAPFGAAHCRQAYLNDVQKARRLIVDSFHHNKKE